MPSRPRYPTLLAAILLAWATIMPTRASDLIPAPADGNSVTVTQPHVTAELIPESSLAHSGKPFDIILHLHMDPGWHTYWVNPGDAGLATTIKWTLPKGWIAGPIQWPTPEIHAMGPLTTYGYGGDVYLLTTLTAATDNGSQVTDAPLAAHAEWLVCQEECVPGRADLQVKTHLAGSAAQLDYETSGSPELFQAARNRLPVANTSWGNWKVTAAYRGDQLALSFQTNGGEATPAGKLSFFPEQPNVVATKSVELQPDKTDFPNTVSGHLPLIQNGEKPDHLSGVLVSDQLIIHGTHSSLFGDPKAIYFASFPVNGGASAPATAPATTSTPPAAPSPPVVADVAPTPSAALPASQPLLLTILGFAFLGGLILNLMPCVLPVLSLKVFSLIKHAGENSGAAWRQGVAFTLGVIVSFWILAGLLIALRAAGNHLGWGFQMQSPGFVLALTFLFFLLSLNLFGVFELGASLVGLDAKASSHLGGLTSSFANGALATLAATPCTAPFMGSSVGFAAQQPAAISLLIFTFLGLGMAAPYLALTTFPGALRLVPKPGAWMESLRQFMGFLLMGTVIFLVYVFGALAGQDQVPALLAALLLTSFAAWIFGRWSTPVHTTSARAISMIATVALLAFALNWGAQLARAEPPTASSDVANLGGWQPYSPEAVKQALAQQRPAFVDFTAAWCLSCKVNERVALDIDSTRQAFAQKHVALFRGDWTHSDPAISKTLRDYNRDGVPLYLLYSPKNPDTPQVLPEVLTPQIVQDAVLGRRSAASYAIDFWIIAALGLLVLGGVTAWLSRTTVAKDLTESRI